MKMIANRDEDCGIFFRDYITTDRKVLFIGTLGFNDVCLHFPLALAAFPNIEFLFLVEERPEVSEILVKAAERNRATLTSALASSVCRFEAISVMAADMANVAGRRASMVFASVCAGSYTDVFVDASAMSRGVCFPIVKQAYTLFSRTGAHAHVVVAGRNKSTIKATSTSSDVPQFIHGFQGEMETDELTPAIKLWIPQLSEGSLASLGRIHRALSPHESCPLLPFPSADPRRGDMLMREFQTPILDDWDVNLVDVIYAHEADPTDVSEAIVRIDRARAESFKSSTVRPARTVLSPAGSRIGSVGMLLAALQLDLPIMYEESIGYTSNLSSVPALPTTIPDHQWHVWLTS